jgi:hypothetical protein
LQTGGDNLKLTDLATSDFVKVLVYGDSGTGKTCFASSFPGPIEYWDFDNKISSAAQFYKNDVSRLAQIDVHQYAGLAPKVRMGEWEKRSRMIDSLKLTGPLPFKTLVLDSLTTFTHFMLEDYIYRSQTGIKRPLEGINAIQDYQLLDRHLTTMITGVLSLPCHVVMLGHLGIEKDEATGIISRQPFMPGKFAHKLPIYFEEVYVSKVNAKNEYVLQTQTDNVYKCRTQRKLAKEVPTAFSSLGVK